MKKYADIGLFSAAAFAAVACAAAERKPIYMVDMEQG